MSSGGQCTERCMQETYRLTNEVQEQAEEDLKIGQDELLQRKKNLEQLYVRRILFPKT